MAERLAEARQLIAELEEQLRVSDEAHKQDPKNWGYVGDVQYVVEKLSELVSGDE